MTALKAFAGAVSFFVGVWTLADLPLVQPLPSILAGWALLGVGLWVLCPALLDLFGVDK
jgi:hypothetical protein